MTTVRSGLGPSEIILKRKYADVQNLLSSIIRRVVFGRGKWRAGVDGFGGLFFSRLEAVSKTVLLAPTLLSRGSQDGIEGVEEAVRWVP